VYESVPTEAELVEVDILGNIFLADNNTLVKINQERKKIASFKNFSFGKIHSIDVTDPFKILVFYKETSTILILDQFLSIIGSPVLLNETEILDADAICNAANEGFWIHEYSTQRLLKYNFFLKEITSSNFFLHLKLPESPLKMLENNRKLYLLFKGVGIQIYDEYGQIELSLNNIISDDIQVKNNFVFYIKEDKINVYNIETGTTDIFFSLPKTKIQDWCYDGKIIYILTDKSLDMYLK
jgi:hypothetical protein